ncbi:hypothetical protein V1514DRAFT_357261, partial [Lipomyces japonicus]|uniref:uncharacterized protein n=1 Tax=Lipomyces japonicus TaxID=56871 RepID=UPI0034CF3BEF
MAQATVSSTCLACRARHLKCDGIVPVCGRCSAQARECVYVKSRRGWKHKPAQQDADAHDDFAATTTSVTANATPDGHAVPALTDYYYSYFHAAHPILVPRTHYAAVSTTTGLLPGFADLLVPVVHYVASFYSPAANRNLYRVAVDAALVDTVVPASPVAVQALLLYAIVLHGDNEQDRALAIKDRAVDMALRLHMHSDDALTQIVRANVALPQGLRAVVLESFRRTFWMLFVIDAWTAGIHRKPSFALWHVLPTTTTLLPRDDDGGGGDAGSRSLQDYDDRVFADAPAPYSSFAYLIDAARILGGVVTTTTASAATLPDMVDSRAAVWMLHLPDAKRDMVLPTHAITAASASPPPSLPSSSSSSSPPSPPQSLESQVDELMILAHIIVYNSVILAHKPFSRLAQMPNQYERLENNTCLTPGELLITTITTASPTAPASRPRSPPTIQEHTRKCIAAAASLSRLITLSSDSIMHRSPFFTCAVTLSTLVHLTSCVWVFYDHDDDHDHVGKNDKPAGRLVVNSSAGTLSNDRQLAKERIRLGLAGLKAMSATWATASLVLDQIRQASRTVFGQRRQADLVALQPAPAAVNKRRRTESALASASATVTTATPDWVLPLMSTSTAATSTTYSEELSSTRSSSIDGDDHHSSTGTTTNDDPMASCKPGTDLYYYNDCNHNYNNSGQAFTGGMTQSGFELDQTLLDAIAVLPQPLISEEELNQFF